eukprot:gene36507-13385_t
MLNIRQHVRAAALPTTAARGAVLAAHDGDDDPKLNVNDLNDAFVSTTTLVTDRGGAMGTGIELGGVLQRSPGGECSAGIVAGALTLQQHALLTAFASTLADAWRRTAGAGGISLAKVPFRAPYQMYYMVVGRGGIDPVTRGLTEVAALTDLGDVGVALNQVISYLTAGDDSPPAGEAVFIVEVLKAKGASGTVTFHPQGMAWCSGVSVVLPLDTTMYLTATGSDGQPLPQRAVKVGRGAQISPVAEGVRLSACFDGTVLTVRRRLATDGIEVGFEMRAQAQVKERAELAQRIARECITVCNANPPDVAAGIGWTAFEFPKPQKSADAPMSAGLAGVISNLNTTLQ